MIRPYTVDRCGSVVPMEKARYQDDPEPRGLIWIFEPPAMNATYFMGVDATKGIPGWHRSLRTVDDEKTDNGVIEVIRKGNQDKGIPDQQVAEYAAPIDPEDLADVANALGRMYAGRNDDGQCMANIEVWPGPGWMTAKKMIHQYGYTNIWIPRYVNTLAPQSARNVIGWQSNQRTMRDLWIRGQKHISLKRLLIRSPWLVEEFTDCETDPVRMTAKATFGHHDDRAIAILLAIYAAHDWNSEMAIETEKRDVSEGPVASWQASDISADDLESAWEERFSELMES